MSDENGKELSLRYLPFKGKKDEWEMWSAKFMSKARKKKYLKILMGEMTVEFEDENNKTTEEKEKEGRRTRSRVGKRKYRRSSFNDYQNTTMHHSSMVYGNWEAQERMS